MSVFRTTRWTLVRLAQTADEVQARQGMERLVRAYWYPLYAFARRQGLKEADAQDVTQAFFARFVAGEHIRAADPAKGRLRSFLLACFKNFMADEWARTQTAKRGAGVELVPLEISGAEERLQAESVDLDVDTHYDRDWAQSLMSLVLERLREECRRSGKEDRFESLCPFLIEDPSPPESSRIQKRLAVGESGFRSALQRLRFRFGEYLWTEIAQTVPEPSAVEEEMRYVLRILASTDAARAA